MLGTQPRRSIFQHRVVGNKRAASGTLWEHKLGDIYAIRTLDYPLRFDNSQNGTCNHSFTDEKEPNENIHRVRQAGGHYSNAHVFFEIWVVHPVNTISWKL